MLKKNYVTGFTLIELLVVVAILGIISSIGVVSYRGYVSSAEKKSAINLMAQISLGQQEYYSDNDTYFGVSADTCDPSQDLLASIKENIFGFTSIKAAASAAKSKYEMCIFVNNGDFTIIADNGTASKAATIKITMDSNGESTVQDIP